MPRISWQLKALLPVVLVLANGMFLFVASTVSFADPERRTVLVVALAGAVIICAVMLLVFALIIREPINELQEKITRVRQGDLEVSLDFASRNDEIGDLGKAFNQMLLELRQSREEIQRLHRTQMSRAEHLATLGEMAAGLAHEIRNPLAGIAGVMEIVGRDLPADSPAREVLQEVRQEVQHINRIVTDLLETARPKPPEFRLASLNSTAEHAVVMARQQAQGVEVELVKYEEAPEIEHDSRQIHQVLLNLLLNAIQAMDGKGKVQVEIKPPEGGYLPVSVSDSGRGIAPEHLPNIFRPFFTTKGHGTGLGLSLARRIVEEHGGRLEVTSAVGLGSTFTVYLPLRGVETPALTAAAVADDGTRQEGKAPSRAVQVNSR